MPLTDRLEADGNWLFRWRSYLPIVLLVPAVLALRQFDYLGHSHFYQEVWAVVCVCVSLAGLAIRALVVGYVPPRTSGRNTWQGQVADDLNTTGMYSLVRNPLYLANFVIWLGIVNFLLVWWLTLIFCLAFWLYYERIIVAEERFLQRKFGERYLAWARRTPAFLPRMSGWRRPPRPFSWRNVLRRESSGLLGVATAFFVLETIEHLVVEHQLVLEPAWLAVFVFGVVVYCVLRTIRRKTELLTIYK